MSNNPNPYFVRISSIILSLVTVVVFVKIVDWQINKPKSEEVMVPDEEIPLVDDDQQQTEKHTLAVFENQVLPDGILKNKELFRNNSRLVSLKGNFASVWLKVRITPNNSERHFVSINFDNESGILNGYRTDTNRLDISKTTQQGGVYTKESPLNVSLNLMQPITFASTGDEFALSKAPTKSRILWEEMIADPPSVVRILTVPLSESGRTDTAEIESVSLEYSCLGNSDCNVYILLDRGFTRACKRSSCT